MPASLMSATSFMSRTSASVFRIIASPMSAPASTSLRPGNFCLQELPGVIRVLARDAECARHELPLVQEVLQVIVDRGGLVVDRPRVRRAARVPNPGVLDAGVHRLAVHHRIGRQADIARQRNDHQRVAAVVVLEVGEIANRGALGAVSVYQKPVEPAGRHHAADAVDPALVLRHRERQMQPGLPVSPVVPHPTPSIRPLHLSHQSLLPLPAMHCSTMADAAPASGQAARP